MRTQSVCKRLARRAGMLAAFILFLTLLAQVHPALAQEGDNRAGLVVQFGDGSVYTVCVDLGADGQATGEEVLRASGLSAVIDYSSGFGGGTVCKLGNEGCSFPAEKCFCQCTMKPGDPCVYWSYFHLIDGQWRYANQGVNSYIVRPGDVEGWAWGPGNVGAGILPSFIPFEQICGASSQAPPPPPATESPLPTATWVSAATLLQPTATPQPTDPPPSPSSTSLPTDTPLPVSPTPLPTDTPLSASSTLSPLPETPLPSSQPSVVATDAPTPSPTLAPSATAMQTPTLQAVASQPEEEQPAATDKKTPTLPSPEVSDASEGTVNYVVFGAFVVALVGGLVFLRARQRQ